MKGVRLNQLRQWASRGQSSTNKSGRDRCCDPIQGLHTSRTRPLQSNRRSVLRCILQAASIFVKWDSLPFEAFPGCVTRCSRPHPYVTIYAAQVCESDKKSKVWLSDLFELQEFLISFLILLLVEEEEKQLWFIYSWEDRGEVNLLLIPQ